VEPECSVSLSKQVDCGNGDGFEESCIGWNASDARPAEDITVRWVVTNTGDDGLLDCVLSESNTALSPATSIGALPSSGEEVTVSDTEACSDALALDEPDLALVVCDCESPTPGARAAAAQDGANFACQTPMLNISKSCVPELSETGEPSTPFEILVRNPGTAALVNCIVTDTLSPGSCPSEAEPTQVIELAPFDLAPLVGEFETVIPDNAVDERSCNLASVTCDIEGSSGAGGPKQITEEFDTECAAPPLLSGCRGAKKSSLFIQAKGNSKWKWKWKKGAATIKQEYGRPLDDTDYRVCIYDGVGGDEISRFCTDIPAGPGWTEDKNGFKYKSTDDLGSVSHLRLKRGKQGKARILVKGRDAKTGAWLPMTEDVVVQISNSDGLCWQSELSSFKRNNEKSFEAH
jgi:hypothetical protein